MCINSKIQQKLDQKAALDAEILKLEELEAKTAPVKQSLRELLDDYSESAPEELSPIWTEILHLAANYGLGVQPLAAEELKQWEAANAEIERLRREDQKTKRQYLELLETSANRVKELQSELEKEKYNQEVEYLRSQVEALQVDSEKFRQEHSKITERHLELLGASSERVRQLVAENEQVKDEADKLRAAVTISNLAFKDLKEKSQPIALEPGTPCPGCGYVHEPGQNTLCDYYVAPNPEAEYEPENSSDTVESILKSYGFFQPDPNMPPDWDTSELYENYRGWDIFYSLPNGGIVAIGLNNNKSNQFWDASTEYIEEIDPTFPESLADFNEIVAWTRQLIDRLENLETPGQQVLPVDFPKVAAEEIESDVLTGDEYDAAIEEELALDDDDSEEKAQKVTVKSNGEKWTVETLNFFANYVSLFFRNATEGFTEKVTRKEWEASGCSIVECAKKILDSRSAQKDETEQPDLNPGNVLDFETMGFQVQVYPSHGEGGLVGATYRFLNPEEKGADGKPKVVFSKSLLAAELGDRPYKNIARTLIQDWRDSEAARLEKIANPYAKEEDKFVELVKITNSVGYLKRRDNGELLAGYAAFSNKDEAGVQTATKAKSRAQKWTDYLRANYKASESGENLDWDCIKSKISEPRKSKRLVSDNPKLEFVYEIKFTGVPLDYLERVARQDLSLLPSLVPGKVAPAEKVAEPATQIFRVKVNSYEAASGTEAEMRSRFEHELKDLGGSQMSVSLLTGS
ncbi:hypothetical protein QUA41_31250, partial [Microcoleus sp. Pol11C1]